MAYGNASSLLDDETLKLSLESSDLGPLLLPPMIKIIISYIKSLSSWFEGIWISDAGSIGAIIISNDVGWFGIKGYSSIINQHILYDIKYSKDNESTINAKWKNLKLLSNNGKVTINKKSIDNTDEINVTFYDINDNSINNDIICFAKKLTSIKAAIDKGTEISSWIKHYSANEWLLQISPYNLSSNIFNKFLNIPIFGYGTLGDRKCDGNNSGWNSTLIHGVNGKDAYIYGWKIYQHETQGWPFANNNDVKKDNYNIKNYKLIGRLLDWNDIYLNAFKIYQCDKICGYNRINEDLSFFKRKLVICKIKDDLDNTKEIDVQCWLWYVDYPKDELNKFTLIKSGDWKDRPFFKYIEDKS